MLIAPLNQASTRHQTSLRPLLCLSFSFLPVTSRLSPCLQRALHFDMVEPRSFWAGQDNIQTAHTGPQILNTQLYLCWQMWQNFSSNIGCSGAGPGPSCYLAFSHLQMLLSNNNSQAGSNNQSMQSQLDRCPNKFPQEQQFRVVQSL